MSRVFVLRVSACLVAMAACYSEGADPVELGGPSWDERAAAELIGAMAGSARAVAALPDARRELSDRERLDWDFWPSRYPGARVDKVDAQARARIDELLRQGLSEAGYEKIKLIQALEPYNPWRSPYYSAMVFGNPGDEAPWGWRYQGHHISLNFTLTGGQAVATTPLFLGVQPLSKASVAGGLAPLADEEALARKLYQSLSSDQKAKADVRRPPQTYLPDRTPAAKRYPRAGVSAAEMTAQQRETLEALVDAYVGNVAPSLRPAEMKLDGAVFAWAGSSQPRRDHYYRVQTEEFIIEYDSRDGGSHIHCVWRSFDGDFGEDLLARHLAEAHRY